jgi:hypothetical protein
MANSIAWSGDGGAWRTLGSALRRVFAVVLVAAVFATAMHHWGCSCVDGADAVTVAASVAADPVSPDQDQCAPGHCHCLCHVVTERAASPASKPVEFAAAVYAGREDRRLWSVNVGPPFEPPCA